MRGIVQLMREGLKRGEVVDVRIGDRLYTVTLGPATIDLSESACSDGGEIRIPWDGLDRAGGEE